MFSKLFAVIAVATVAANAQAVPGLTPCILNCVGPAAAANGCGSITNTTCVCTHQPFLDAAGACIQRDCPGDAQAAADLSKSQCGGVAASGSAGPSSASSTRSGGSAGAASATGTAPASSSSKAAGFVVEASVAGIISAVLVGALSL